MIVFKIVRVVSKSTRKNGRCRGMHSGYVKHADLRYRVGVPTFPKFGMLFAFESLRDAIDYLSGDRKVIYMARAAGVKRLSMFQPMFYSTKTLSEYKKWWKTKRINSSSNWQFPPKGTVVCKSITLIKRIRNVHTAD